MLISLFMAVLAAPSPASTLHASDCPAVFGTSATRKALQASRQKRLLSVDSAPYTIDLLHTAEWTQSPAPTRVRGARLLATSTEGVTPIALIRLDAFNSGCPRGTYALKVDDKIGSASVLAILDGTVLLEMQGTLHYWSMATVRPPTFRLTWRAPFRLRRVQAAVPALTGAAARPVAGVRH